MNIIIRTVVTLIILLLAYFLKEKLVNSKPELESKKQVVVVPLVDVVEVSPEDYSLNVSSFGAVRSYFETDITPEVTGKITYVSPKFRVGEMVSEGEVLATIDDADFQSTLATEKAGLILMESALVEEEVRAKQASDDWLASGRELSTASDFVLRKPQMAAAKANIDAARTAILRAENDVNRAVLRAPFDAVVSARSASLGSLATSQSSLGTLVATAKAEVRIPLTSEQMQQVVFSDENQPDVVLVNPNDESIRWPAKLTRMEPTVDPQNQVSYGIATVERPYANDVAPLPIGTFVNVQIPCHGSILAYQLKETALVNDSYVWLLDAEDKLLRVDAVRLQSDGEFVYVEIDAGDLKPPLRVVSRPLSNFLIGTFVESKTPAE